MKFKERFGEVDALRGFAIILMVVYHAYFAFKFINDGLGIFIPPYWILIARLSSSIFITLVGVSLSISYSRAKKPSFEKYFKRGFKIFCYGLLVTIGSYLIAPDVFIVFGILHFIGVSIILAYPFLKKRDYNFILFPLIYFVSIYYLQTRTFDFPYLLFLGFLPTGFYTLDYFPLFPSFGLILLGIHIGSSLYPNGIKKFEFKFKYLNNVFLKFLSFLGRYSLFIYLVHIPTILTIFWIFSLIII